MKVINKEKVLSLDNPDNWLTNGETFSKKVYLGINANKNDWWEITEDEKEKMETELEKKRKTATD